MSNQPEELPAPPSFVSSTVSGITGFVKGALAGGGIGGIGGALVGALMVAVSAAIFSNPLTWLAVGAGAAASAGIGASALGAIGAAAGTITGVMRSREANQPSAQDMVNIAKISFAQGVSVGHNIEHAAQVQHGTKHRDEVKTQRANAAVMAESHVIN